MQGQRANSLFYVDCFFMVIGRKMKISVGHVQSLGLKEIVWPKHRSTP